MWLIAFLLLVGGAVFVPLSIEHIRNCRAIERELRKLQKIADIEDKYGITISEEDLRMR